MLFRMSQKEWMVTEFQMMPVRLLGQAALDGSTCVCFAEETFTVVKVHFPPLSCLLAMSRLVAPDARRGVAIGSHVVPGVQA